MPHSLNKIWIDAICSLWCKPWATRIGFKPWAIGIGLSNQNRLNGLSNMNEM